METTLYSLLLSNNYRIASNCNINEFAHYLEGNRENPTPFFGWSSLNRRYILADLQYPSVLVHSGNAYQSTLGRRACKWATPAGSSTAWSTASIRTGKCPATIPWATGMILSTRSSPRRVRASTCRARFWLISSRRW